MLSKSDKIIKKLIKSEENWMSQIFFIENQWDILYFKFYWGLNESTKNWFGSIFFVKVGKCTCIIWREVEFVVFYLIALN